MNVPGEKFVGEEEPGHQEAHPAEKKATSRTMEPAPTVRGK